jgi:hypothetical protein
MISYFLLIRSKNDIRKKWKVGLLLHWVMWGWIKLWGCVRKDKMGTIP